MASAPRGPAAGRVFGPSAASRRAASARPSPASFPALTSKAPGPGSLRSARASPAQSSARAACPATSGRVASPRVSAGQVSFRRTRVCSVPRFFRLRARNSLCSSCLVPCEYRIDIAPGGEQVLSAVAPRLIGTKTGGSEESAAFDQTLSLLLVHGHPGAARARLPPAVVPIFHARGHEQFLN